MLTRVSFVEGLGCGLDRAWSELDTVYRPLIFNWLKRYQVQNCDAEDIAQEVMAVVARRVDEFEHNGRAGAFRNWLRTITVHIARKYLDKTNRQPDAPGASVFLSMLDQLESESSDLSQEFRLQHDRFVLQELLRRVSVRFQSTTIEAFRLHAIEGRSAAEVAEQLGIKPQTVYVAKGRVLHEMRELAADFLDDLAIP